MVTMSLRALSNLQCEAVHEPSGTILKTDAPKDVGGDATSFSPTDMVGVALLSCIMTTMGLVANKVQLNLTGMKGSVEKTMTDTKPRRIAVLKIVLDIPGLFDTATRDKLEHVAHECPVHHSLHPDITMDLVFNWNDR